MQKIERATARFEVDKQRLLLVNLVARTSMCAEVKNVISSKKRASKKVFKTGGRS